VPRHVGIAAIRPRAIRKTAIIATSITSAETVQRTAAPVLFRPAPLAAQRDSHARQHSTLHRFAAAAPAAADALLLLVGLFRFLHGVTERHSGFFNRHDVLQPRRHLAFALAARERRRRKSPGAIICRFERH
jgi:hypothetical protein